MQHLELCCGESGCAIRNSAFIILAEFVIPRNRYQMGIFLETLSNRLNDLLGVAKHLGGA